MLSYLEFLCKQLKHTSLSSQLNLESLNKLRLQGMYDDVLP
jgi:hypothetical protein